MSSAPPSVRNTLLELQQRDLSLRAELEADGTLFDGYHPRMEAVHRANAEELRTLIARHGWPSESVAGSDGAEAAWMIAQHSIAEPKFMRRCRELLEKEVASGAAPLWQFAYLDDRIRVSEGRPQRFGTQFEFRPDGPALYEVEEPQLLDQRRSQAGLAPIEERLTSLRGGPRPTFSGFAARKKAELEWRIKVGWSLPSDA